MTRNVQIALAFLLAGVTAMMASSRGSIAATIYSNDFRAAREVVYVTKDETSIYRNDQTAKAEPRGGGGPPPAVRRSGKAPRGASRAGWVPKGTFEPRRIDELASELERWRPEEEGDRHRHHRRQRPDGGPPRGGGLPPRARR